MAVFGYCTCGCRARSILFRDRDSKYTEALDTPIALAGVEVRPPPPQSPNTNALVERWIQSVKVECLVGHNYRPPDEFIATVLAWSHDAEPGDPDRGKA